MTEAERGAVERAFTFARTLGFLGAELPDACCQEEQLWRVFSKMEIRGARSWGRLEGAMRIRARLKVTRAELLVGPHGLILRVLPRDMLKSIVTTISFSNPELR